MSKRGTYLIIWLKYYRDMKRSKRGTYLIIWFKYYKEIKHVKKRYIFNDMA